MILLFESLESLISPEKSIINFDIVSNADLLDNYFAY